MVGTPTAVLSRRGSVPHEDEVSKLFRVQEVFPFEETVFDANASGADFLGLRPVDGMQLLSVTTWVDLPLNLPTAQPARASSCGSEMEGKSAGGLLATALLIQPGTFLALAGGRDFPRWFGAQGEDPLALVA